MQSEHHAPWGFQILICSHLLHGRNIKHDQILTSDDYHFLMSKKTSEILGVSYRFPNL